MTAEAQKDLKNWLATAAAPIREWSPTPIFDLSTEAGVLAMQALRDSGQVSTIHDSLEATAQDLHMLQYPHKMDDEADRDAFVAGTMRQGEQFGDWVFFPWTGQLVHYPGKENHRALHVFRNQPLVRPDEQAKLSGVTTAHLGLSVGSVIAEDVAQASIGDKSILADRARIKPTNLNRMRATQEHVGMRKTDYMGMVLSGIDPYREQVHLLDGFGEDVLDSMRANMPDIIFEEMDSLVHKALAREFARREKIPLIMVTDLGDIALLDIERYDTEDAIPFGGRLKYTEYQQLLSGKVSPAELKRYTVKIVGARYLTIRMISSTMEVGKTTGGLPQLGDTAALGSAMATKTARAIFLGEPVTSGRHALRPRKILGLPHQTSVQEGIQVVSRFARSLKNPQ